MKNRIDFPLLLNKFQEVDYNWLLTGRGKPVHPSVFCDSELAQGEVQMIHNPKTVEALDDRSVMLYDIAAAANLKTPLTNKCQYTVGRIHIPNVPRCDGAVYVCGDSMYPILKSGDIIGFEEITHLQGLILESGKLKMKKFVVAPLSFSTFNSPLSIYSLSLSPTLN